MSVGGLPRHGGLPGSPIDDGDLDAQAGDLGALLGANFAQELWGLLEHRNRRRGYAGTHARRPIGVPDARYFVREVHDEDAGCSGSLSP